jgi:hypothetical protein
MTNTFEPKKQPDPYKIYEGKEVRCIVKNGSSIGVLQEINPSDISYSLMPSLISINLPNEHGKWIDNVYICEEIPTKIKKGEIDKIEPLPEGYMFEIAKRIRYHAQKGYENSPEKEKPSLKSRLKKSIRVLRGKDF